LNPKVKPKKLTRVASRSMEALRTLPRSSTSNPAGGLGSDVGSGGSGARL